MRTLNIDPKTVQAICLFTNRLSNQFNLADVILFGSRARQTHTDNSDADVAILLRGIHLKFLTTKLAMSDIAFDILLDTGINISPLPIWLDEWEHPESYSNPSLLINIAKDGVRV